MTKMMTMMKMVKMINEEIYERMKKKRRGQVQEARKGSSKGKRTKTRRRGVEEMRR